MMTHEAGALPTSREFSIIAWDSLIPSSAPEVAEDTVDRSVDRRNFLLFTAGVFATVRHRMALPAGPQKDGRGSPHPTEVVIDGPSGLAWSPRNILYIAEKERSRVLALDPRTRRLRTVMGTGKDSFDVRVGSTAARRSIRVPTSLALDARGGLWIVDQMAKAVVRVDLESNLVTDVIDSEIANRSRVLPLYRPSHVAVAGSRVYISDWAAGTGKAIHAVYEFDLEKRRLGRINSK